MVYGLLRALPGDRACCHRHLALLLADLTPASGRQNHTPSPSASAPFVTRAARVHRIPPHVRDDRETPLRGTGPNRYSADFTPPSSKKFGKSEIGWLAGSALSSLELRLAFFHEGLPALAEIL